MQLDLSRIELPRPQKGALDEIGGKNGTPQSCYGVFPTLIAFSAESVAISQPEAVRPRHKD